MKKPLFLAALFAAFSATAQRVDETDTLQVSGRITLRNIMVDSISKVIPTSGQTDREVPTDKAVANYIATSITGAAQTLTAGGSTSPTVVLSTSGGSGGGTVTLNAAGGSYGRSGNTITYTPPTYTATTPIVLTGADFALANSGATAGTYNNLTVTAKGIVTGGSNVAYLSAEIDGSTTNEIQALTRTSTNNTANLSVGGGSATVEDLPEIQEFAPTTGSTVTLTGTLPTAVEKYRVERNGIVQNYGAGKGVVSIVPGTGMVTFTRAFSSGEIVRVIYPKQ